jgi:uncharacterized membrane protein YagU involved in acid resistance
MGFSYNNAHHHCLVFNMSLTESVVIHWIFACIVSMGFLLSSELGRVSLPKLGLCVEQMGEQVDTGLVTSR